MSRRLLWILLVVAACKKHDAHGPAKGEAGKYRTDTSGYNVDPKVAATGKTFMVVSEAELATKVGHDVLAAGGNAADAAIATAFALAVVHPTAGNIAGGGFAVIRNGKHAVAALDFRETAPAAATPEMYLDKDGKPTKDSVIGDRASGVPGSVAGLWALHEKYGKTPWKDLVAPAIALAQNGFPIDIHTHAVIERAEKKLAAFPATAAMWLPGGKPRPVGDVVKLPELATVLQRISDKGPDGFYKGETAAAIVDEMKKGGGLITAADLEGYKVEWRAPMIFDYRGKSLATMPLPSSGGIVLAMSANMLRAVDVGKLGWHSADHLHWLVEVWRRVFAARNDVLGDPAYVKDMPLAKLRSQEYAERLVKTIGPKATPSKDVPPLLEGDHTTNLCVVDASGMAIAMTTTLNIAFGSGVMVSGFFLNDEMDDFAAKPGEANTFQLVQGNANKIEPGKRMLSSMSPTIVEDDQGELVMVVGAQGGPRIITAVWQVLSNVIDFGMTADAAVAAPRIHHQHLPDEVVVEDGAITKPTDDALTAAGYALKFTSRDRGVAAANAIVRTPTGWQGAADPRGGGAAMGD